MKYLSFKDLSGVFCVLQDCVLVGHDKFDLARGIYNFTHQIYFL
jgi:hypothetical protein